MVTPQTGDRSLMSRPTSFLSTDSIHHLTHRYRQQRQTREQIIQLVNQAIEEESSISHVNKRLMKGGELAFDAPIGGVTSHIACCIEVAFRYKRKVSHNTAIISYHTALLLMIFTIRLSIA